MTLFNKFKELTKSERILWVLSVVIITASFLICQNKNAVTLLASLIGVTALIFVAKADVLGHILTVMFSLFYAFISYQQRYYGEMITYMCMTAPMAVMALVSWLKHPFEEGVQEVKVNHLHRREVIFMSLMTVVVTVIFYFILDAFKTANLIPSTISIATSFLASYLTFRRSEFYALAYAANDIVLIVLWILAAASDIRYLSMVFCFIMFLANDLYGFINWSKIKMRQSAIDRNNINAEQKTVKNS